MRVGRRVGDDGGNGGNGGNGDEVMRAYGNNGDGRPSKVDDSKHYNVDFGVHDNDCAIDLE